MGREASSAVQLAHYDAGRQINNCQSIVRQSPAEYCRDMSGGALRRGGDADSGNSG